MQLSVCRRCNGQSDLSMCRQEQRLQSSSRDKGRCEGEYSTSQRLKGTT